MPEYFETTDYDKFSYFDENRDIDIYWVEELAERINQRNLLQENPIIVTQEFEVIEGQHRLEAAKLLGIPIYYIASNKIKSTDIPMLNDNRRNWKYDDYLFHFASMGKSEYVKVKEFIEEFPFVSPYTVILLSSPKARKLAGDMFKQGDFVFDEANSRLICEQLAEFREHTKFYKDKTFIGTIIKFNQLKDYHHQTMLVQIAKHPEMVIAVRTEEQCAAMLEDIYNYNRPKRLAVPLAAFLNYPTYFDND